MNGKYLVENVTCLGCGVKAQRQKRKRTKPTYHCPKCQQRVSRRTNINNAEARSLMYEMKKVFVARGMCGTFLNRRLLCGWTSEHSHIPKGHPARSF